MCVCCTVLRAAAAGCWRGCGGRTGGLQWAANSELSRSCDINARAPKKTKLRGRRVEGSNGAPTAPSGAGGGGHGRGEGPKTCPRRQRGRQLIAGMIARSCDCLHHQPDSALRNAPTA
eukprot:scaffold3795_cov126-Isochrysis_galbana.AAC.6